MVLLYTRMSDKLMSVAILENVMVKTDQLAVRCLYVSWLMILWWTGNITGTDFELGVKNIKSEHLWGERKIASKRKPCVLFKCIVTETGLSCCRKRGEGFFYCAREREREGVTTQKGFGRFDHVPSCFSGKEWYMWLHTLKHNGMTVAPGLAHLISLSGITSFLILLPLSSCLCPVCSESYYSVHQPLLFPSLAFSLSVCQHVESCSQSSRTGSPARSCRWLCWMLISRESSPMPAPRWWR